MDAPADQLGRVNQQPSRYSLFKSMSLQVSNLLADQHQVARHLFVDAAFVHQYRQFELGRRVIELHRHESLPGRLLQILEHALIAGVVRYYQHEFIRRLQDRASLFDRQDAAVIRERVDEHQ